MKISYNWLKWYIPEVPEAEKLSDIITYHLAEVETVEKLPDGDSILDIKILPNRAHDLLSHLGIAREIASLLNLNFVDPTPKYKIPTSNPTELKIEVETENCRRYVARIVRNVTVGPSPEWVVKHLESIGQRSINNIVDASNIVLFDTGNPTHCFDLNKTESTLIIREAHNEEITTLDNKKLTLNTPDMVVADSKAALEIAGLKGGKAAEVNQNTKNIILEISSFDPTAIRKMSQRLNIRTEGAKRHENDFSPELGAYAMREFSALIAEMCPEAVFEDIVDAYPFGIQSVRKLSFSLEKITKILGVPVSTDEVKDIFKRYNFEFTENAGQFEIIVPPMRLDLVIEEDMAEEIGRILGYDKVKGNLPKIDFVPKVNETYAKIVAARSKLLGEGYSEVMTYAFRDKGEVEVMQSASDKKFLRTNLTDGLMESLKLNKINSPLLGIKEARPGQDGGVKIFEIGTVFYKDKEEIHVAYNEKDKIIEKKLEEFLVSASADASPRVLGFPGPQPRPDHTEKHASLAFIMWSLFPFIARDVAVWVPEGVGSDEVMNIIRENMGELVIRGPELFDEFKKDGKVSYAFRIVFQSYNRTLTDAEVNTVMEVITAELKKHTDWQVR